jgi:hypothetical protein
MMVAARRKSRASVKTRASRRRGHGVLVKSPKGLGPGSPGDLALEEARQAGLLEGERSVHVSFRVPRALLEAAQREAGVTSPTELGLAALALLAQPDRVAAFFKRTRGRLGKDHKLEY